jgi:hypothetical protein
MGHGKKKERKERGELGWLKISAQESPGGRKSFPIFKTFYKL